MNNLKCERCSLISASFKCAECNNTVYCNNCCQNIHSNLIYKSHNPIVFCLNKDNKSKQENNETNRSLKNILDQRREKIKNKITNRIAFTEINELYIRQKDDFNKESAALKDQLLKLNTEVSSNIDNIKLNINKTFTDNNSYLKTVESNLDLKLINIKNCQDEEMKALIQNLNNLKDENANLLEKCQQNEREILFLKGINCELEKKLTMINRTLDEQKSNLSYSYDNKINLIFEEIEKEKSLWKDQYNQMRHSYDNTIIDLKIQLEKYTNSNKQYKDIIDSSVNIKEFNDLKQNLNNISLDYQTMKSSYNELMKESETLKKKYQIQGNENLILKQKVNSSAYELESFKNENDLLKMKLSTTRGLNLIKSK